MTVEQVTDDGSLRVYSSRNLTVFPPSDTPLEMKPPGGLASKKKWSCILAVVHALTDSAPRSFHCPNQFFILYYLYMLVFCIPMFYSR